MPDTDPTARRDALFARLEALAPDVIELVHAVLDALADGRLTPVELWRIAREAADVARTLAEQRRHAAMVPGSPDRLT